MDEFTQCTVNLGKNGAIVEYFLSNNISMAIIMESW